jgi:general secretion pathway protein I
LPTDRTSGVGTRAGEGFTLIELLVALAVFSLAALALLNLSGENTRSAARVEARTLGGIVAENRAVEAVIAPAIAEGITSGQTPLADRDSEGQAAERTVFRSRTRP